MLHQLSQISAAPATDDLRFLIDLVDQIRPPHRAAPEQAQQQLRLLVQLLQSHPQHAGALRQYLLHQLSLRRQTSMYTDVGILSNDGFFTELHRRVAYRLLPPALDERFLSDCLAQVFPHDSDYLWLQSIPLEDWEALLDAIGSSPLEADPTLQPDRQKTLTEILLAIQVLSYRISAIGIEPELIRIYSDVKAFESPFLVQNAELHRYLDGYMRHLNGDPTPIEDASHVLVMLEQCQEVVKKIRRSTLRLGTSIAVTYRLVRLDQHLDRLRKLLAGNFNLPARNITESASRTGEHYVAENRSEYAAM